MPKIKKMYVTVDGFLAPTKGGTLWNNTTAPLQHYHAFYSINEKISQLDISKQLKQCSENFKVINVVLVYEATFLMLGRPHRPKLELMKVWKKEAFHDILIKMF